MSDCEQRTEQATPHRTKKAREEGRFPVSREFLSSIQFAFIVAVLMGTREHWIASVIQAFRLLLRCSFQMSSSADRLGGPPSALLAHLLVSLTVAGSAVLLVTVAAQLAITGFGIAPTKLKPDFARLNPASRLSGITGRNFSSFCEALIFLLVLCYISWRLYSDYSREFMDLAYQPVAAGVSYLTQVFSRLFYLSIAIALLFGALDLVRQRRRYAKELRMTKQEVKDEWKQNEGNPETKLRIRRLRYHFLRRGMMAEVPKASTVIVNPTHFAVALRYEHIAMAAPRVVAKGKNYLALRMREVARAHQVPIVENPPLAQALYRNCELGQEIPESLYRAVAEVLAYVHRILARA